MDSFPKPRTHELAADILTRSGTVLVCWEHSQIAERIAALSQAPDKWPGERYDLLWCLQRVGAGWAFEVLPQLLLSGDAGP